MIDEPPTEAPRRDVTFAEYLAVEAGSETKHELVNGEIRAMAGGTLEHGRLAANLIGALTLLLRGRSCSVFTSDVRIRVQATGLVTYPDLSVACGRLEHDPEDRNTLVNPLLLVEVLSDSTEAYDRGEKSTHYRRIPSLRDYLLVAQRDRHVEHYHRNDDGSWTLLDVRAGGEVWLPSLDARIAVDAIYDNPPGQE